jgi:hypothetical protein
LISTSQLAIAPKLLEPYLERERRFVGAVAERSEIFSVF